MHASVKEMIEVLSIDPSYGSSCRARNQNLRWYWIGILTTMFKCTFVHERSNIKVKSRVRWRRQMRLHFAMWVPYASKHLILGSTNVCRLLCLNKFSFLVSHLESQLSSCFRVRVHLLQEISTLWNLGDIFILKVCSGTPMILLRSAWERGASTIRLKKDCG